MLDLAVSSWVGVFVILISPETAHLNLRLLDGCVGSTFGFCGVYFSAIIDDAKKKSRRSWKLLRTLKWSN